MTENLTFGLAFNIAVWVVFVVFAPLFVMSCHAMNKTPIFILFYFGIEGLIFQMMLSPDSRQCVSIQPRVFFLSMSQQ
jgi:hypothetical protein